MNNFGIGASLSALAIGVALRILFTYGFPGTLPFALDAIDAFIVLAGAVAAVSSSRLYIINRYPDTADMLPLFCGVVLCIIPIGYYVLRYHNQYQTALSILVTGVFVGMGWWIQAINVAANSRRTHTLNIIMASRTSSEYQLQTRNSSRIYRASAIPPELAEWRFNPNKEEYENIKVPQQIEEAIQGTIYILNYFEFLAQGIKYKDLDACLLRECFSSILAGLERRGFHLILEAQKLDQRSFEGVIRLAKEWNNESAVEKYRSNPSNAAIGPLYPSGADLDQIINGTCGQTDAGNVTELRSQGSPSSA